MIVRLAILGAMMLTAPSVALAAEKAPAKTAKKDVLETDKDKLSYCLGMRIGKDLGRTETDIDVDLMARGMKDVLAGRAALVNDEDAKRVFGKWQSQLRAKHMARQEQQGEKNKKDGEAFLAKNKKVKGVVTLPSGLQYKVIKAGKGQSPKATDGVTVNYRGYATRRHRVRQLLQARKARELQGRRSDPWLDRSFATDEAGRQVEALHSVGAGLRQQGQRPEDRPGLGAYIRG